MTSKKRLLNDLGLSKLFPKAPSLIKIQMAAKCISTEANYTPLLEFRSLNERLGGRVLIKAETMQRTGSFKFRGAFNKIKQINLEKLKHGVVSYSSGNHGHGVAAAAKILGARSTIAMPLNSTDSKIQNIRKLGGKVVIFDPRNQSREDIIGELLEAQPRASFVHPFDDPDVIAGQGTCGLEIITQVEELGVSLDGLLICCSGGGLASGLAIVFSELSPRTNIYSVEPEGFDDTKLSLKAGHRIKNNPDAKSFCDALLSPLPGELTFSINRKLLTGGIVVSDEEVMAAMSYAFHHLKLIVEPGGAVALAALLAGRFPIRGKTIAITLSGGNVDLKVFQLVLENKIKSVL